MKSKSVSVFLVIILFVGMLIFLYPALSNAWNVLHQSRAIVSYSNAVNGLSANEKNELLKEARDYNEKLIGLPQALSTSSSLPEYDGILDHEYNGMIGYVTVSSLGINLPVFHGTSENVLSVGAGHLEGSSFPVGGESTHAVISAHRGLPSARLFTDIDKMKVGDVFTVTVLDRTLSYRVKSITTVTPDRVEPLSVVTGEDLCTLLTCTPYGINTHRLLVCGERIVFDNILPLPETLKIRLPMAFASACATVLCFVRSRMKRR